MTTSEKAAESCPAQSNILCTDTPRPDESWHNRLVSGVGTMAMNYSSKCKGGEVPTAPLCVLKAADCLVRRKEVTMTPT